MLSDNKKRKKLQIRTGGFVFWFMGILICFFGICFFGICFIGVIVQLLTKGFGEDGPLVTLLVLMLFIYFIGYFICFINGNRIVLDEEKLIIYDATWYGIKRKGFPQNTGLCPPIPNKSVILLKDIENVLLGTCADIKEKKEIDIDYVPKRMRRVRGLAPILLITKKGKTQSYVYTEPYSEKEFEKLLSELSNRGIKSERVVAEE